ncbi:MAG: S9 family peptidase [Raineya sp.]|nr:S9 family peptidase [Raineya sp.]
MYQRIFALGLLTFLLLVGTLKAQEKKRFASLQEALSAGSKLSGNFGPRSVNWIEGGEKFSFIEGVGQIKVFSPKDAKEEIIFNAAGLKFPDKDQDFSYSSFQWSKDSKYLLFQTNFRPIYRRSGVSDYYFYDVANKTLRVAAKDALSAELSPDGKKVAYEKGGNLFVLDFATQKETQLTNDAQENVWNGRFGWVYEEEFGLAQAWEWSPDSKYIAFWQTDERNVPIFQMTDYSGLADSYEKLPYPKVGNSNPIVKIGMIDVEKNQRIWAKIDLADGYIPRIYWTARAGELAIMHLNRKQNHLKLYFANVQNGDTKLIMEETSKAWIDVFDFFAGIMHYAFFPQGLQEFFWISERDGFAHIYRYDYNGKLLGQVTKGNWEVVFVHNIDVKNKKIYYTSTEVSPLERHLYEIDFSGKNKRRLTQTAGRHIIDFSPNSKYYLDRYSNTTTPIQVELWEVGKTPRMLKKLVDNAEVSKFIQENAYSPRELTSFTTSDGQKIDIYLVKPLNFNPNQKYPLLLNIYGGPGAQSVYNEFGRDTWEQYLAQQGYVVASVNNRGSGGYGYAFEKIVYEQLGKYESKDFAETAQYLVKQGFIDANRIAIRGHSYGGYMSAFTILNYPEIFKVAIVAAPVTDWRLYDSIYAERYMGLLPENDSKYISSSCMNYVKNFKGKMLLVHSAMDENVHVKHTFQLVKAMIDTGKDVDLRIFPPGNHGVAYSWQSRLLLYSLYTDYLEKNLK